MEINKNQIENLNKKLIDWRVNYSVYPYNSMTINELICNIFDGVNNSIDVVNEYTKIVNALYDWVKGEGLEIEVKKEIDNAIKDGRIESLINKNIFSKTLTIKKELSNENLNDVIETGIYIQSNDSESTLEKNYPLSESGVLQVVSYNGEYCQTYNSFAFSNRRYTRCFFHATGWNAWKEISNDTIQKEINKNTQNIGVHSDNFLNTLYIRENLQKENLNDVIKTGIYNQHSNSNVVEGLNYPLLETSGALIVIGGSDKIFQIYQTYMPNNKLYTRSKYNNEWSSWQDLTNARTLNGYSLATDSTLDRVGKITMIDYDNSFRLGEKIMFIKNNQYVGVLYVENGQMKSDKPINSYELETQYLHLKTYGNGTNYGQHIFINAYVNNQNDSGQLLWENVKEFNISTGSYKGKSIIVDNDVETWNGSFVDKGDDRKPKFFTRRDLKGWQVSDKNLDFWSLFAKSFDVNSDERIKNIYQIKNATKNLEIVNNIMPKLFSYVDNPIENHYGFIAQEVEKLIPTCVKTIPLDEKGSIKKDKNGDDMKEIKTINPMDLISTLWSATQELSSEVELLKIEIENLKNPK